MSARVAGVARLRGFNRETLRKTILATAGRAVVVIQQSGGTHAR